MEIVYIRDMNLIDISRVMRIEHASFEFPWTEQEFTKCLKRKTIHRNTFGLIAEQKEIVVGYLIYQLHRRRAHVLNVAVKPDSRRGGVCRQLFNTLVLKCGFTECCKTIFMEVRETNLNAQLAFRSLGFKATSVLKDFYNDEHEVQEDAYMMQYKLSHAMVSA